MGVIIKNLHNEEPYELYSVVGGMYVDLYLPNGCKSMGIPSNTAIEYKNTRHRYESCFIVMNVVAHSLCIPHMYLIL